MRFSYEAKTDREDLQQLLQNYRSWVRPFKKELPRVGNQLRNERKLALLDLADIKIVETISTLRAVEQLVEEYEKGGTKMRHAKNTDSPIYDALKADYQPKHAAPEAGEGTNERRTGH